jgi:hypothetical protein
MYLLELSLHNVKTLLVKINDEKSRRTRCANWTAHGRCQKFEIVVFEQD